jgi:hypothetical protein
MKPYPVIWLNQQAQGKAECNRIAGERRKSLTQVKRLFEGGRLRVMMGKIEGLEKRTFSSLDTQERVAAAASRMEQPCRGPFRPLNPERDS